MDEINFHLDDIRRLAPLHYWARADNARFAARTLWTAVSRSADMSAPSFIGYHGTPSIALYEAFRREAAIALELIIKATIAWQIEDGKAAKHVASIPMSHDLPRLWHDAQLPPLGPSDAKRLLDMKWALLWSSRYPAPKDNAARERQELEFQKLKERSPRREGLISSKESFGWDDFDRIYTVVVNQRTEGPV